MAAEDQVDSVLVEQRRELLPDAEVCPVAWMVGGGDHHLVHYDDYPVDGGAGSGGDQLALQEAALCPAGVSTNVAVAAVLEADIVVVEADEAHGADGERV